MTTTKSVSTATSTSMTPGRPAAPGLVILPLRLFLGLTFVDAGLGKLLSAAYLGHGPQSFVAQARGFAHGSPIGGLVRAVAVAHPTPTGLLLAVAELAIGVLTLAGLLSRAAAAGGLALSLTFFLTASWHTRPFFYGPDLPFAVGWLVLVLAGDAGLPSLDRRLARRQRALAGLGDAREVALPLDRVQQLCAAAAHGRCAGATGRTCRGQQCPLLPQEPGPVAIDAGRRALLARGALAGVVLVGTGVLGAAIAAAERVLGSDTDAGGLRALPRRDATPPAHATSSSGSAPTRPAGTRIGGLNDIPIGQAAAFTTRGGRPAAVVRLGQRRVVAYSAVCTHAGCTVGYDSGSRLLTCPCHGAQFDPARGATPVAGPTSTPLPAIALRVGADGGLYLPPSG
ncbi:MAG TPA: TQO small subunit DoxD [Actinomycetes bacterium]|nr:TQO small subunit DoxD [Actinomycetes bacterium]